MPGGKSSVQHQDTALISHFLDRGGVLVHHACRCSDRPASINSILDTSHVVARRVRGHVRKESRQGTQRHAGDRVIGDYLQVGPDPLQRHGRGFWGPLPPMIESPKISTVQRDASWAAAPPSNRQERQSPGLQRVGDGRIDPESSLSVSSRLSVGRSGRRNYLTRAHWQVNDIVKGRSLPSGQSRRRPARRRYPVIRRSPQDAKDIQRSPILPAPQQLSQSDSLIWRRRLPPSRPLPLSSREGPGIGEKTNNLSAKIRAGHGARPEQRRGRGHLSRRHRGTRAIGTPGARAPSRATEQAARGSQGTIRSEEIESSRVPLERDGAEDDPNYLTRRGRASQELFRCRALALRNPVPTSPE